MLSTTKFTILVAALALIIFYFILNINQIHCGSYSPIQTEIKYVDKYVEKLPWIKNFGGLGSDSTKYCFPSNDTYKNEKVKKVDLTCVVTFEYISSGYELKQMEIAKKLDSITDFSLRRKSFVEFLTSEVELEDSYNWINLVDKKMDATSSDSSSQKDSKHMEHMYLSRFEYKKSCGEKRVEQWTSYIEPLSIHGRHPYAIYSCLATIDEKIGFNTTDMVSKYPHYFNLKKGLGSVDHILLDIRREYKNYYLLDAGTSYFKSSLWWFVCAYLKKSIKFDKIYGWEYSLLEPRLFWDDVPSQLKSIYSFFNAPVSSGTRDDNSPLRFILDNADTDDFVAFKLDIDNSDIEIPIAVSILRNKSVHQLIDEFFFELHFRCELLMLCGWGDQMPDELSGIKLSSRYAVMNFFKELRVLGIRSHTWP